MKTIAIFIGLLLISGVVVSPPGILGASPVQDPDSASESEGIKLAYPEVPRIPAEEVKRMIAEKADFVIVDTQPADNYAMWHLPSAVNIPFISTANPMDRQLMLIALPMDKLIVIYCLCEEGTDSARMARELIDLGYGKENIKVLEGGLIQWDASDYPLIRNEERIY
ncbi:MAG: rhodanese-like domain-containing protein [Acidobacteria bacterium]|nr:rhodanese-like domain-containing protein [Acidobacteriota bacterium]